MRRGEIRWYTFRLPDKRRPVMILTRNEVIGNLNELIVVPVTSPAILDETDRRYGASGDYATCSA